MERQIVFNSIITPDGTRLVSRHRHDFVLHVDKNGQHYLIDGGNDYLKRSYDKQDYTEASLYMDDDYEEIRKYHCRGGRGKDGKQPLTWTPLCQMSQDWLKASVEYNTERGLENHFSTKLYQKELDYRKEKRIFTED